MASPAGVGRIETLLMQKNFDAERVKLGPERHKVFQDCGPRDQTMRCHVISACSARRSHPAASSLPFGSIAYVFLREAKPNQRHLQQGGLRRLAVRAICTHSSAKRRAN